MHRERSKYFEADSLGEITKLRFFTFIESLIQLQMDLSDFPSWLSGNKSD